MKVALIGVGKWGTTIKKTLESFSGVEVLTFDKNTSLPDRQAGPTPLLSKEKGVQAVIIATPGSTHAAIALPFIEAGHPVFIEKPMTTNLKDALRLESTARQHGGYIFVGHVHLYNPAFLKAKELVQAAGNIRYVSFEGMNWGPFRDDMSALWDWIPHDIAMALDLFGKPTAIQAWGNYESAVARLLFGDLQVFMHISSLSLEKRKKMTVVGEKYGLVLDDTRPEKKLILRQGEEVTYPEYDTTPPLTAELKAFLEMVKTGKQPKTDITNGVEVVRILDAAEQSIKLDGQRIAL